MHAPKYDLNVYQIHLFLVFKLNSIQYDSWSNRDLINMYRRNLNEYRRDLGNSFILDTTYLNSSESEYFVEHGEGALMACKSLGDQGSPQTLPFTVNVLQSSSLMKI